MNRVLLKVLTGVVIAGSTIACDGAPAGSATKDADMNMMMPNAADSAATAGYKSAMMKMMRAMPEFSGDADVDFMKQMRSHHQAAIDMANVLLANGKDAQTMSLARKIIAAQESEIMTIDAWLKAKGV